MVQKPDVSYTGSEPPKCRSSDPSPLVGLSLPLQFQQDIFFELTNGEHQNSLLIIARGLGLLKIVVSVLHTLDVAGNGLILILRADDREVSWLGESIAEHAALSNASDARGLRVINTGSMGVNARYTSYRQGGVYCITSRILIVDLLSGILDPTMLTSLILLHAERISPASVEAFIIRIFRQKNKSGLLKAFTDDPEYLSSSGFSPLTSLLRTLHTQKCLLYPRFQVAVAASLEGRQTAEVIELEIPMTPLMNTIQMAILECIEGCLSQLKRARLVSGIDMEDWNTEYILQSNFVRRIRAQVDHIWYKLSSSTKQIIRDLELLRTMLNSLLRLDAVTFNKQLDIVRLTNSPISGSSYKSHASWFCLNAADTIFETARQRVFSGRMPSKDGTMNKSSKEMLLKCLITLEEQPKWRILSDILDEIETDIQTSHEGHVSSNANQTVLIMCSDLNTCIQLREYLQTKHITVDADTDKGKGPSAGFMMHRKLRRYVEWKLNVNRTGFGTSVGSVSSRRASGSSGSEINNDINSTSNSSVSVTGRSKRRRVRGGAILVSGDRIGRSETAGSENVICKFSNLLGELQAVENQSKQESTEEANLQNEQTGYDNEEMRSAFKKYELIDIDKVILIHSYRGDLDDHILEEVMPTYIIMYEPDAAFIRRIEVYRSSHAGLMDCVKVYFMYYHKSVEEQRYLSSVRREKDAFTRLIRERASMPLVLSEDTVVEGDARGKLAKGVNEMDNGSNEIKETVSNIKSMPKQSLNSVVNWQWKNGDNDGWTNEKELKEDNIILVDVREFQSELPAQLHGHTFDSHMSHRDNLTRYSQGYYDTLCHHFDRKRVIQVVPAMLTTADYILNVSTGVERKSMADLRNSLNNGRLYKQACALTREFGRPILLIEFEWAKTSFERGGSSSSEFCLLGEHVQSTVGLRGGISAASATDSESPWYVQCQLAQLTLACPELRIVWSNEASVSANIFVDLKLLGTEKDTRDKYKEGEMGNAALLEVIRVHKNRILNKGNGKGDEESKSNRRAQKYAITPLTMLSRIPALGGADSSGVRSILRHAAEGYGKTSKESKPSGKSRDAVMGISDDDDSGIQYKRQPDSVTLDDKAAGDESIYAVSEHAHVTCIADLADGTQEQLTPLLGVSCARSVVRFFQGSMCV